MFKHQRILVIISLALALVAPALVAQSVTTGDISGTVTDATSAAVPNAAVTATNRATGIMQATKTNSLGFYHFAFLPPGQYQVEAKATGFQTAQRNTEVSNGQGSAVDIQLAVAGSSTTVEVTEAARTVQVENADLTTNITQEQLALLPNSGNDMTSYALVSPGAVMSTSSGYGNFSVFGLPATANLFTLNGQNDNDIYLNLNNSGASNLMLGANELAEATVVANGYSGQYGQLAGAQVNYITKVGTNRFHGNAEWFWNGRAMNANDWFNNQSGVPRPFANANQWAASVGGPIIKNKTFFFADYEGLRNILPTGVLAKIPSPQFQTATLANLNATGQTAAAALYTTAFNLYNHANGAADAVGVPGGGCGTFTLLGAGVPCVDQFRATNANFTKEYLWAGKVDHNFSERDQAYLRLWRDNGTQPTATDPIAPIFNVFSPQPQMQGQIGETHTFSPTAVNQMIFSGFYYSARFGPPDEGAVLAAFPTVIRFLGGAGSISNIGGTTYNFPQGRNVSQYQFIDDFSKTYGKHTLKVGTNYRRYDISYLSLGVLTNGRITELNLADFYNGGGTGNYLQQRFPSATEQPMNIYQLGAYVQDEWRVTRNLKVIGALRLDHQSNPVCGHNCFARLTSSFDTLNHDVTIPYNKAILANQAQAYSGVDEVNWQPRVGFAWTPTKSNNTVIRGGFGIFFNAIPGQAAGPFFGNTPELNAFLVSNGKVTPGVSGNLFSIASGANQSLLSGFNSGQTLAQIKAANPFFSLPGYTATANTLHTPQYQEWNLEVQQALPAKMVLSVNYVGNHGIHETYNNNSLNAYCDPTNCGGFPGLPTTVPDARFGAVSQYVGGAVSNYNGLVTSLKRRFANGLLFQFNYTYSHALDEVSNGGFDQYDLNNAPSILSPENPYNLRKYNYGNADYDVRHFISASYVWQDALRHMFHGGPNVLFSGWTVSGTIFHRTGLPFTVIDSNVGGGLTGFNYGGTIFAQQVAAGPTNCGKSSIDTPCFANSMFTDPATFASQTRNQFRGPGYFNTDMSLMKEFRVRESAKLSVGAQFYNLFNHPNFDKPINDFGAGPGVFGTIVSTVTPPTSVYGAFVGSAVSGRLVQVKAQFVF
jgi:hypothetical protein